MLSGSQTRPAHAFTARNRNLRINYGGSMTGLDGSWVVSMVGPRALGVYAELSIKNLKLSTK